MFDLCLWLLETLFRFSRELVEQGTITPHDMTALMAIVNALERICVA